MHPRQLLARYGLKARKGLGQNFLVDQGALQRIVAAAELTPEDTVLEIGPGLGALTRHLAAAAGRVVAVELDQDLIPILQDQFERVSHVELVQGDILALDPATLVSGTRYKVVANVPYYITAAILRHMLAANPRPERIVFTVQREVAERLTAGPGDMSVLAVSVQLYGKVTRVAKIKAGAFFPRPEVDSAVVRVDIAPELTVPVADEKLFFRVVRAGFGQKRKQLRNSLKAGLSLPVAEVEAALTASDIDPRRRAETLTLSEWATLSEWFRQQRKSAAGPHAG